MDYGHVIGTTKLWLWTGCASWSRTEERRRALHSSREEEEDGGKAVKREGGAAVWEELST